MRTNYVLIDYENVQPNSLAGLDAILEGLQTQGYITVDDTKVTYAPPASDA